MQTYKRSTWNLIKGLVLTPFAAVFGVILILFLYQFIDLGAASVYVLYGVPILLFVWMLYSTIFSENIRFELEPTGRCRYYVKGKLKHDWDLTRSQVGYYHKSSSRVGSDHNISFTIQDETGRTEMIDCSPLGPTRFHAMFDEMEKFTKPQPEVLRAE